MPSIVTREEMTDENLASFSGRVGTVEVDSLNFGITVVEARVRFGHLDLRVAPLNGTGAKWFEAHRVSLDQVTA